MSVMVKESPPKTPQPLQIGKRLLGHLQAVLWLTFELTDLPER
jgi:hypothetical protein